LKHLTLIAALCTLLLFASCRDYISGVFDNTPPEMSTDAAAYHPGDTVLLTFKNNSSSTIYVIGAYNLIEKKNSAAWDFYSQVSCIGGCPEFPVYGKSTIYDRIPDIDTDGTYRFVCAYSSKTGETYEQKTKAYSNEFQIISR
jgi:hypothetical protein